ncbi:DUF2203 family protein [Candidatus Pacearchaeota archaeon]|nr:DUF2203 family protein [Candidatus Pacearchaeota archaeon]
MTTTVQNERFSMAEPVVFTIQEANKRVVLMSRIADDIEKTWSNIHETDRLLKLTQANPNPKLSQKEEEHKSTLNEQVNKLNRFVNEMEVLGVRVLTFNLVIVAFSAKHKSGRPMELIWKNGDVRVTGWKWPHNNLDAIGPIKYNSN